MMVKSCTLAKSTASAFPLPATLTVTSVAPVRAPASSVAVTATTVAPASSKTLAGVAVSAIPADVASLSRIVPVASLSSSIAPLELDRVTTNVSSGSSTASSSRGTRIVCRVTSVANVSVALISV